MQNRRWLGGGEYERDDSRRRRQRGTRGLEVVLEVDGDGYADLLINNRLGDEAEDGATVLGAIGGVEEGVL
ncbi:hypothetical protein TIFTF001_038670 [Ficus carica]|uniref:Uncharacterized protein n=1 Tax=Ficus carica TaxID=3494 RepID=A0AA88E8G8_FICCA|nr:hypothetical protein TIFTF001_038658 [Ficus carica]GMN69623.1 hypothetical protein TIFTF001_038670 [Ficus carica]